jgi:DNA-binding transcriptional LysR family regulator
MDRLGAVRLFAAITDAGSLSGAGRRLGVPLTTVSRKLTRRLTLTEQGRQYLKACRRIIEELDAAEAQLSGTKGEPQGELAITAPVVFGRLHVLALVSEFLSRYPRIDVRMLLLDRPVDLIEEGIDIAVRIGHLPDSMLIATRVGAVRQIVCASPAYLAAHGKPERREELGVHACITFVARDARDRWTFTDGKKQERVRVHSRLTVNTAEAAIDAARAGVGIARVLSYQAAAALADGSLESGQHRAAGQPAAPGGPLGADESAGVRGVCGRRTAPAHSFSRCEPRQAETAIGAGHKRRNTAAI